MNLVPGMPLTLQVTSCTCEKDEDGVKTNAAALGQGAGWYRFERIARLVGTACKHVEKRVAWKVPSTTEMCQSQAQTRERTLPDGKPFTPWEKKYPDFTFKQCIQLASKPFVSSLLLYSLDTILPHCLLTRCVLSKSHGRFLTGSRASGTDKG